MTEVLEPVSPGVPAQDNDPKQGKLKVKVVGKCTGDAIKGAEVLVNSGGKKINKKTDSTGIADMGELPARDHLLKVKMHFTDADYFLILIHYPRVTWRKKALVEAVASATVPEGGEVELRVEINVYRVVAPIIYKRKQIDPFTKDADGEKDPYGHWWTELGGESYGWWPSRGVGVVDTVFGIPGALNGVVNGVPQFAGGSPTTDPHDGEPAGQQFSPVIDDCRSDEDLKNLVRSVARGYSGNWSWFFEFGNHCHTFQKKTISTVNARGFRDV